MNTLKLKEGREFSQADPAQVIDFLKSRSLKRIQVSPESLHITGDGLGFTLQTSNGAVHEYPARKSFVYKLLKWFSFPLEQLNRLNTETVTLILNDYLLHIRSGEVTITIEDGDALTITSKGYSKLDDLDLLELCKPLGVEKVSRNDFFTRLYSEIRLKKEVVPGDDCGFGLNVLNSETGFRSLSVYHYIMRYQCTNGAVARIKTAEEGRVHYGYPPGELRGWLKDQIGICEATRERLVQSLMDSQSQRLGVEKEGLLKKLHSIAGRREGESIAGKIPDGASVFDAFNVLTTEAKRFDVSRRLQLETLAGQLLPQTRTK